MQNKKFGAFSSSVDPQQLSQTITSALAIVGYVVSYFAAHKGVHVVISNTETQQVSDALVAVVMSGLTIWQSGKLAIGFFRRCLAYIYAPKADTLTTSPDATV